jgi:hypothetical protein
MVHVIKYVVSNHYEHNTTRDYDGNLAVRGRGEWYTLRLEVHLLTEEDLLPNIKKLRDKVRVFKEETGLEVVAPEPQYIDPFLSFERGKGTLLKASAPIEYTREELIEEGINGNEFFIILNEAKAYGDKCTSFEAIINSEIKITNVRASRELENEDWMKLKIQDFKDLINEK